MRSTSPWHKSHVSLLWNAAWLVSVLCNRAGCTSTRRQCSPTASMRTATARSTTSSSRRTGASCTTTDGATRRAGTTSSRRAQRRRTSPSPLSSTTMRTTHPSRWRSSVKAAVTQCAGVGSPVDPDSYKCSRMSPNGVMARPLCFFMFACLTGHVASDLHACMQTVYRQAQRDLLLDSRNLPTLHGPPERSPTPAHVPQVPCPSAVPPSGHLATTTPCRARRPHTR